MAACFTLLNMALVLYGQHRVVSAVKVLCPEKQGDVRDMNFNKQWYDSSDEAERAQVGLAAYKAVIATQDGLLVAFVVLLLARALVDFGSLPFILLAGIWLLMKLSSFYYGCKRPK